jgi:hypothetical protein
MRLDATGLGIGTSSPSAKLQVGATTDSSNVSKVTVSSSGIGYLGVDSSGTNGVYLIANNSGSTQTGVVTGGLGLVGQGAYPLIFGTNSTERMRLDSSGNLGLGVTPSAWDTSPYKAFQIGAGVGSASVIGRNDSVNGGGLALNAYYSSTGYRYIGSSFASLYLQASGQHQFYTAASGTAGDAISFTQALTLHASGGLSLGNTTDYGAGNLSVTGKAKIITSATINSSTATTVTNQASGAVLLRDNTNGGTALVITDTTGGLVIVSQVGATTYVTTSPTATQIQVTNNSGNIQCLGGSSRNGTTIITTALQLD